MSRQTNDDDHDLWAAVATLLVYGNRREQERVAASLRRRWGSAWDLIDVHAVYGSTERWLDMVVPLVERAYYDSQSAMAGFLDDFLFAKAMQFGDDPLPPLNVEVADRPVFTEGAVKAPSFNRERVTGGLVVSGPGTVIDRSPAPVDIVMNAGRAESLGYATSKALDGGSKVVETVQRKHSGRLRGWQRVTDTDPCAFCALLASRGAEYHDLEVIAETSIKWDAVSAGKAKDNGARVHPNCRCTLIPVYKNQPEQITGHAEIALGIWLAVAQMDDLNWWESRREYARRYDAAMKKGAPPAVNEDVLRRQVEAALESGVFVEQRARAAARRAVLN